MKILMQRHLQVFMQTLARMMKSPTSTLVAIIVIAIAVSLPLVLFKITTSLQQLTEDWQGNPEITVFLKVLESESSEAIVEEDAAVEFGYRLLEIPSIRDIEYVSPEQAFENFKQFSGFGDILSGLNESPLPPMLIVYPEDDLSSANLKKLIRKLQEMEEAESISYDQQWLDRLHGILELFAKLVWILSSLMGVAVILIISNTVRLGILDRADEIQIIDQIGGTGGFVRRPFLYYGVLQGALGALTGWLISNGALYVLNEPVLKLAELYSSHFRLGLIGLALGVAVIVIASVLGWLAARITSGNYLRKLRASVRGK